MNFHIDKKLFFRMTARGIILALGMVLLIHFGLPKQQKQSKEHYPYFAGTLFTSMSTTASVRFYTDRKNYDFSPAFDSVRTSFKEVEKLCNFFDPESELSRLNKTAAEKPFVCSPELWKILSAAREYKKRTGGAFDVSISPLLELWGFYRKEGKVPDEQEIAKAMARTGLDKVRFDETQRSVFFTVPGMSLNLGGIAKGYALDHALAVLQKKYPEIKAGFIDLGGNVLCFGSSFQSGIRDPFNPSKICAKVELKGTQAVATSGGYERFIEINGHRYGHILDPRTGKPVENCFSSTVIAPSGLESDILSTSFYVAGKSLANVFPQLPVLIISPNAEAPDELSVYDSGADWTLDLPVRVPAHKTEDSHRQ